MSTPDPDERSWAFRSTLVAVSDLDRSVAFYQDLGPFGEIARKDAVAVLGGASPPAMALILRESQGTHLVRHGQQSLGLRSINFSVGSVAELDRIEAVLRQHNCFTYRRLIGGGASDLILGRDPDNLPLLFVCYSEDQMFGPDYYEAIADLTYALDT
jgi:catechol 2,3-dioxygenase-like lactoylglutathione lyase family enzyme